MHCATKKVKSWTWWKKLLLGANFQVTSTPSASRAPRPINPVLGSISLAVQRIYGSLDNPYTSTITFLLVTWTLHKISMMERSMTRYYVGSCNSNSSQGAQPNPVPFKWASILDILLDCVLVSKFLYAGVVIQVRATLQPQSMQIVCDADFLLATQIENDATITAVQALAGLLAAVTLNRALIAVHFPVRDET